MAFCTRCGAQIREGDTFCSNCGAKSAVSVVSHLVCPKCSSENIQKYALWKKSRNKVVVPGLGCLASSIGCLILVILLIFAPLLLLLLGIGMAMVLPIMLVVALVALVVYLIQQGYESNRYICLKCGHTFKP